MDNYNKYMIEDALTKIAKRKVKSFYIEYFSKFLSIDVPTALYYLDKFSKESDKIKIKYEVRCSNCFLIIKEYEKIEDIIIGSVIECDNCDGENEITLELNNLYIKYYIDDEWLDYIKKKQEVKKTNKNSECNCPPNNPPANMRNITEGSLSVKNLNEMKCLEVLYKENNSINFNFYINNGNAGAMGEMAKTIGANFR